MTYPTVKLRPKTDARNLRFGYPWVYADQIAMDRRTKAILPGSVVKLVDGDQRDLGLWAFNALSKITLRKLDPSSTAVLDQAWFENRLIRAKDMRDRLFQEPYYRLIHAEADRLPGVIIDRFGDMFVVQPNAAWADERFDLLSDAISSVFNATGIVKNGLGRARKLEGLPVEIMGAENLDTPIPVPMNGAIYMADLAGGQKTGLFFDQRPNHAFAAKLAQNARVLDVFSHVGGFGLASLAGGAASALCVDASQDALDLALQGAAQSGFQDRLEIRKGDAFDVMVALKEADEKFDLTICDPPAFAPAKPALEAGLRAYERVARLGAGLTHKGGYLVLCSCSHAATEEKFQAACLRGIGKAGRSAQLIHKGAAGPDHPIHPQLGESGYLKALFFRLD